MSPEQQSGIDLRLAWVWALSPAVFGLCMVILLAEFSLIEFHFSIHDVDTFIWFLGLLLTIIVSSVLLSREGIRLIQLRTASQYQSKFTEDRVRFLRRLDHEIKNPLMGIKTALDNLADTTDSVGRREIRQGINKEIDRLTRLVADLRKIGDMQHHEIEQLPVNVDLLLDEAFTMASDELQWQDRELQFVKLDFMPPIKGDYDLLLLAIHNVLNNAIKYTRTGDKICLSADCDDTQLIISVRDSGPGICPEDLPHVWEELYRSQHVKDVEGSGIGLAMVRQIIKRHGGNSTIHSTVGMGTTVKLHLPRVQAS